MRMGKKDNKSNGKGVVGLTAINNVPNRDVMQRMNFLWQASVYFEGLGGGARGARARAGTRSAGDSEGELIQGKKGTKKKKVDGGDLARMYVRTMNIVGQRTTTKMDPGVKRALCRGCSSILVPGISARIRTRPSQQHEHWMIYTCSKCGTSKKIPAPRNGVTEPLQSHEVQLEIGTMTAKDIDTPMEGSIVEEPQQRSAQPSNSPRFHATLQVQQQQQSQHHSGGEGRSEEDSGDKGSGSMNKVRMGDRQGHGERNSVVPLGKTKSLSKQKKTKKKKSFSVPPAPREPPLFARKNAGHVVYRGAEIIDMEGVYCV